MTDTYLPQLQQIFTLQRQIQDIHPFLQKLYPVAIVKDAQFLVYDAAEGASEYHFVSAFPTPMPIPHGIRAAFPLEAYDMRMACVVTDDVFNEEGGYVTIFHEFLHCQQFDTCEMRLKENLKIAQQESARGNQMWEIEYAFPYDNTDFVRLYQAFLESETLAAATPIRTELRHLLPQVDYEYMVWQEWKEGFARRTENLMRARLGLRLNQGKNLPPYDRVIFYAGGEHFIDLIAVEESVLVEDIEALFGWMFEE